ncbi:MAG: glycosyltransferase family 4 protein [Candidatus Sumerlaeia bacterium]
MNELRTFPNLPKRAYVVSQFPEFCETFILNEMMELSKRGVAFEVFSLKPCRDAHFQPGAREIMDQATHYGPPIWHPMIWLSQLYYLFRHPSRWFSSLGLVWKSRRGGASILLKSFYVFLLAAWFARKAAKRDIAHIHAHWASIPSTAGLLIAKFAGLPFSLTAHAYDIFIDRTLLREKMEAARYIVTCTQYNGRFLRERYPEQAPGKVEVVYHGVDLEVFRPPAEPREDKPVVLSVGRLCDTKGFPDLLDACMLLRDRGVDFRLKIIGDGYMREELESQIERLHLGDLVEIAGLLPREEVRKAYAESRLFVLPCVVTPRGDRDGIPNVILEAMAMGMPVVGTDISGLPEAIEDGVNGRLIPPHAPEKLADAIQELWENADLRERMGRASREKVERVFGLQMNMDHLAGFIHEKDGSHGP